jgi:hypothetical protein
VLLPRQQGKLARGAKDKEHAMSQTPNTAIAVIGIDIGKNSFHVVGHDARGAIVLRQKWSRGQVEALLGQKRRFGQRPVTSGLPGSTDILRARQHVSKGPILLQKSVEACGEQ